MCYVCVCRMCCFVCAVWCDCVLHGVGKWCVLCGVVSVVRCVVCVVCWVLCVVCNVKCVVCCLLCVACCVRCLFCVADNSLMTCCVISVLRACALCCVYTRTNTYTHTCKLAHIHGKRTGRGTSINLGFQNRGVGQKDQGPSRHARQRKAGNIIRGKNKQRDH